MRSGRCATGTPSVFIGLGGNFVQAAPDTEVTCRRPPSAALTVQVSTKINRSHLVCGETALILPTLGRTETRRPGQRAAVRLGRGLDLLGARLPRAAARRRVAHLRSEVAIVTGLAEATLGDRYGIDWRAMRDDYRADPPTHRAGGAGL